MRRALLIGICLFSIFSHVEAYVEDQVQLKLILFQIEENHGVEFNYDDILIRSKTLAIENQFKITDVDEFLKRVLPPIGLSHLKINKKTYVIIPYSNDRQEIIKSAQKYMTNVGLSTENLTHINTISPIKITVSGRVTDDTEEGIPGVNIVIEGTQNGVITDVDGNYIIDVEENTVLIFSFVGYRTVRIPVNNQSVINVQLEENTTALDEIVVIGYGSVKKSDLTGAISSIKGDEISSTPITSFDQGLQGRAAGVQVVQVSGRPGGETSIRIRGTSSISAGNEPLYVIDGMYVISNASETSSGGNRGPKLNPLSSINPNDISSIEILKDASALSIYGSRGSNGVILITTKNGNKGTPTVNLDMYYGTQNIQTKLELLNGESFARFINEVNQDKGFPLDPDYLIPENYGEGTDWQDAIFQNAPIQSYQLSFSGGNNNALYNVSAGYFNQDGIIIGSDFERANLRTNLKLKINKRVTLGTNIGLSLVKSNGVLTNNGTLLPGVSASALLFPPTQPVFDESVRGGYTFEDNRGRNLANPYADAKEVQDNSKNYRALGTIFLTYNIIEGLQYKLNFGFDAFANRENRFVPNYLKRTESNNGEAVVSTVNGLSWLLEHTFSYNNKFGDRHSIDAVAGFTTQAFSSERLFTFSLDFDDNITGYNSIQLGNKPQTPITGVSEWGIISYLARVNYIFDDKYLFTISGRVDGSSKFGINHKYAFFPSGSFAWRISSEDFFPENAFINFAKFRFSYGVIGNEDIGSYNSLSTVGLVGEGSFGNTETYKGKGPLRLANPDLVWEKANQFDGGVDLDVLESRINLNFDYYLRFTSDLLLDDQVSYTTGFGSSVRNIGSIRNQGVELSLNTVNIEKDFRWTTTANIGYNVNEVTSLAKDGLDIFIPAAIHLPSGWSILRIGEPVGSFFGLVSDGIFQSTEEIQNSPVLAGQKLTGSVQPGDRKYKDINGRDSEGKLTGVPDGVIDEADRSVIGSANPKLTWGLTNKFEYKGFDLNIFIQGAQGHQLANVNLFEIGLLTAETNVLKEYYENRWTEQNPTNKYPRLNPDSNDRATFSDAYLEDASYIRIQNISLGYRFKASLLDRLSMSNARVYVSGNNIKTFTKYSGFSPEGNAFGTSTLFRGIDFGGYPAATSLIFGIQLTFK